MGEQKSGEEPRKKVTGIATVVRRAFDKLADDRVTRHLSPSMNQPLEVASVLGQAN